MAGSWQQIWVTQIVNFSWVTSKVRGSFDSSLLRASWHGAPPKKKCFRPPCSRTIESRRLKMAIYEFFGNKISWNCNFTKCLLRITKINHIFKHKKLWNCTTKGFYGFSGSFTKLQIWDAFTISLYYHGTTTLPSFLKNRWETK